MCSSDLAKDEFSEEMENLLNALEEQEKKYVIYKFQLGLSNEEIATIFKVTLNELSIFSNKVFSKLRNSEEIKKFLL